MAISLNGTNQFLSLDSAPVNTVPLTMALRFNQSSASIKNLMFLFSNIGVPTNNLLGFYVDVARVLIGYIQTNASSSSSLTTTAAFTANQWQNGVYIDASTTSRTAYLNGGNSASSSISRAVTGIDRFHIGAYNGTSGSQLFNGSIADVALWSADLTAAEVASYSKGFKPSRIRPQSLVFYAPLIREIRDWRAGRAVTNNNSATVANHPRVY